MVTSDSFRAPLAMFGTLLALSACARPSASSVDASSSVATSEGPDASACEPSALRLGNAAVRVASFKVPDTCKAKGSGDGSPVTIRSEAEFRAQFICTGDAPSGIDFVKQDLVVQSRMLSPASVGTDVYDNGATVTFVSRQRTNCPNDPMPMPYPYTITFLLPAHATRVFADASCTVYEKCPRR